jgi:hypothetical protein
MRRVFEDFWNRFQIEIERNCCWIAVLGAWRVVFGDAQNPGFTGYETGSVSGWIRLDEARETTGVTDR